MGILLADDQHVGDLLELGLTDPVADLLIAVVHLDPQARSGKFLRDLLGDEQWETATNALTAALKKNGKEYIINEGERPRNVRSGYR